MRPAALTALMLLASACGDPCADCDWRPYADQTHYTVEPMLTTPQGVAVDDSGLGIPLEVIDRLIDEVETCLISKFGQRPRLPADFMGRNQCDRDSIVLPIRRECLTVKVPSDWVYSADGKRMLLDAHAPDEGCLAKGLKPDKNHPCRWQAGLQDSNVIVAPPSLYNFKDPLVRVVTRCNSVWFDPGGLTDCVKPSLPPLPTWPVKTKK
jgi:hypothetical protein